jgi:hypothetical protein
MLPVVGKFFRQASVLSNDFKMVPTHPEGPDGEVGLVSPDRRGPDGKVGLVSPDRWFEPQPSHLLKTGPKSSVFPVCFNSLSSRPWFYATYL